MNEPERIAIETGHSITILTSPKLYTGQMVSNTRRNFRLTRLADETLDQAVVFASTQDTDMLAEELAEAGVTQLLPSRCNAANSS